MNDHVDKQEMSTKLRGLLIYGCTLNHLFQALGILMLIKNITFGGHYISNTHFFGGNLENIKKKKEKSLGILPFSSNYCCNSGVILSRSLHAYIIKQTRHVLVCVFTRSEPRYLNYFPRLF